MFLEKCDYKKIIQLILSPNVTGKKSLIKQFFEKIWEKLILHFFKINAVVLFLIVQDRMILTHPLKEAPGSIDRVYFDT